MGNSIRCVFIVTAIVCALFTYIYTLAKITKKVQNEENDVAKVEQ